MDCTIEIMLPHRDETDFSGVGNDNYPMLCIVTVYPDRKAPAVVGMQRTGYIHVTNLPDAKFAGIKESLEGAWTDNAKRVWAGLASRFSAQERADLLADRQIEMTWGQFRSKLRHLADERDFGDADEG